MEIGQIYYSCQSQSRGRIVGMDVQTDTIRIEWFECNNSSNAVITRNNYSIQQLEVYIKNGLGRIDLSTKDPNLLFKKRK